MTRHPRLPALIVLSSPATLASATSWPGGRWRSIGRRRNQTLDALRKQVEAEGKAGAVSAGDVAGLRGRTRERLSKRFAAASNAYQGGHRARAGRAGSEIPVRLVLAQAGASGPFYDFLKELVYSDAKVAEETFSRPEGQPYLKDERFTSLAKEAKNQAMD